ncbi:phage tail protein [Chitinophaga solisilvae]|uniref:Phage tail protein n=1 Tax=Chitinophaga solisilvae TaxID=1233460 RepID=A0A3S1D4I7_9BACT|nr:phage tail protein [Chitinophaga solisilvae]NSL86351.1 phage tail protein [Chitinophaga solisilvae]
MATTYYPPVSFHFKVEFGFKEELHGVASNKSDIMFQSVAGLSTEIVTEMIKEGGENRFEHELPVRTKFPNLVLKRGLIKDSSLIKWCLNTFEHLEIRPVDLEVKLLNEKHEPLVTWAVKQAWPKKWAVEDLNAQESKVLVESLELRYQFFTIL